MELHNEIFSRVKRTFGLFSGSDNPKSGTDFLIKMNLPPLIGRRDAAVDAIGEALGIDLFELEPAARQELYRKVAALLSGIQADTKNILAMLSSPDTASRERRMLAFWTLLFEVAFCLETLAFTDARLALDPEVATEGFITSGNSAKNPVFSELSNCEIRLVNRLRELFESGSVRLTRYREYTAKSFSKPNASRYRKSYDEYRRIYGDFS